MSYQNNAALAVNEVIRLRRGHTGLELSELFHIDDEARRWGEEIDGITIEDTPDDMLVVCDFADFDEVVAFFITTQRPVFDRDTRDYNHCLCVMEAASLAELTREELGYTNEEANQQFAIYAVACMLPDLPFEAVTILWRQINRTGRVDLDTDLYQAAQMSANPHILEVLHADFGGDLNGFHLDGQPTGVADHYMGYDTLLRLLADAGKPSSFEEQLTEARLAI